MKHSVRGVVSALVALALLSGTVADAKPVTVAELIANSPAQDWRSPDPENTLYLEMRTGRVVIELAPEIAPAHVANIKTLVRAHYFDGLAIIRVQDNYVVQWDDPDKKRAVPPTVHRVSPEFTAAQSVGHFDPLPERDVYASEVGFLDGFPAGRDSRSGMVWLAHCYGMVGVGRDDPPESDGTEMYTVIGNSPRQLDRNVTLVGRALQGIELLSSLPRGSGDMGFYSKDEKPVPIVSMRIAADLTPAERTPVEILRTDSATFHRVLDQRRNRREPWFQFNPGHIDLCNVPLPVRTVQKR
jgi:peptidylprolyl isomerase